MPLSISVWTVTTAGVAFPPSLPFCDITEILLPATVFFHLSGIVFSPCGTSEYPSNRKHSEVRQLWSSCHEFEVCPEKGTALELRLDKI